ncbi:hypothetical protein SDC9_177639 [bioreactor metagenome]|uniref:Uncharacterized protein n=1 Tax=bioreactor metagenome TaxID=1076179 RepID=A0A645GTK5_9ZZZZ
MHCDGHPHGAVEEVGQGLFDLAALTTLESFAGELRRNGDQDDGLVHSQRVRTLQPGPGVLVGLIQNVSPGLRQRLIGWSEFMLVGHVSYSPPVHAVNRSPVVRVNQASTKSVFHRYVGGSSVQRIPPLWFVGFGG